MTVRDTVLSMDVGQDDCFYRILRSTDGDDDDDDDAPTQKDNHSSGSGSSSSKKRIVYVVLKYLDLIPEASRTSGPDVIRALSQLREWPLEWKTLTVVLAGGADGVPAPRGEPDEFPPHALSQRQLLGNYEYFDILGLAVDQPARSRLGLKHKHRSFRVAAQGGEGHRFLKIARFGFELDWLAQEMQAHHILAHRDTAARLTLAPRVLGYAYEGTRDRVVGLLFEEVAGRRPGIADLGACQAALQELHDLDIIHGDVVRDNMFVTEDGAVKFIDFEESCVGPLGEEGEWNQRKDDEMQSLRDILLDEGPTKAASDGIGLNDE